MKIGVATSGLWRLREAVEMLTGGVVCRLLPFGAGVDAVAGWGHKLTAARAREIAKKMGVPYIAFEDGFLRSILPGNSEKPVALVMDRTGIYYDSTQPSDLEALISRRASTSLPLGEIRQAMKRLRTSRLSKYNNSRIHDINELGLRTSRNEDRVLVVDQTAGDASIIGAMASKETFELMLEAAVSENQGAEILVRVHPETTMGRKPGHFSSDSLQNLAKGQYAIAKAQKQNLIRLTPEPVNPWALLESCSKVYCVSSQLGFEGLMAGCEVHCFGMPFYAGWGLTNDHMGALPRRHVVKNIETLFFAVYNDYCKYVNHKTRTTISFEDAVSLLSLAVQRSQR